MAHFEKTLDSAERFRGKIFSVTVDRVELEDGSRSAREIVHHHGGAAILPLDGEEQVYLVRQYRYAFGRELLEIPAGKLERGEDPRAAAIRELREECGLIAEQVTDLGCIYPSVGYDDEVIHLFLATGLSQQQAAPDQGEFLTPERIPLKTLVEMALSGELHDAKTVTAILKSWMLRHTDSHLF